MLSIRCLSTHNSFSSFKLNKNNGHDKTNVLLFFLPLFIIHLPFHPPFFHFLVFPLIIIHHSQPPIHHTYYTPTYTFPPHPLELLPCFLPLSPSSLLSSPSSCSISSSEQTLGTRGMKVKHRSSFGSPGRELKNK